MAASSLTGSFNGGMQWDWQKDETPTSQTKNSGQAVSGTQFQYGTGSGEIDRMPKPHRFTIAPSSTATIDLSGVLTDFVGDVMALARLRGVHIVLDGSISGQASGIQFGGATNPITTMFISGSGVKIYKGGFATLGCAADQSYAITAGSADSIVFTNLDAVNTATVDLYTMGVSV